MEAPHVIDMKRKVVEINKTKENELNYLVNYLTNKMNGLHTVFHLFLYDIEFLYRQYSFMSVSLFIKRYQFTSCIL